MGKPHSLEIALEDIIHQYSENKTDDIVEGYHKRPNPSRNRTPIK